MLDDREVDEASSLELRKPRSPRRRPPTIMQIICDSDCSADAIAIEAMYTHRLSVWVPSAIVNTEETGWDNRATDGLLEVVCPGDMCSLPRLEAAVNRALCVLRAVGVEGGACNNGSVLLSNVSGGVCADVYTRSRERRIRLSIADAGNWRVAMLHLP